MFNITSDTFFSILKNIGCFGGLFTLSYFGIWLRKAIKQYADQVSFKSFLVRKHITVSTNLNSNIKKTSKSLLRKVMMKLK